MVIPVSTRVIGVLRLMFPGEWTCHGSRYWQGPDFKVVKKGKGYYRDDTGERIRFPKRKKRNHYIVNILKERLGGKWIRQPEPLYWYSEDHDFKVYRTTHQKRMAYRRDDTDEIVYSSNGKRFYLYYR